jgi:hypothetical protein
MGTPEPHVQSNALHSVVAPTLTTRPRHTKVVRTRAAWWAFSVWILSLVIALSLEGTTVGRSLFRVKVAIAAYLVIQGIAYLSAVILCGIVVIRGSKKQRLAMMVPVILMLAFAAILAGGPG